MREKDGADGAIGADRVGGMLEGEVVGAAAPDGAGSGGQSLVLAEAPPRDRHPALVYLASLSEGSRGTMRGALEAIAAFVSGGKADASGLAWHALRYQHTALIRATLAEAYAPATANKMLSALRGVLKECFRLGLMTAEDYQRARDLPPVRGETLPKGRSLSSGELGRLFAACADVGKRNRGARDAAMIAVLCGGGLNRFEAATLDVSDLGEAAESLSVGVRGGPGGRRVVLEGLASELLREWLALRGRRPGKLFLKIDTMGREILDKPFLPQNVAEIVRRRAMEAGIGPVKISDLHATALAVLFADVEAGDGGPGSRDEPVQSSMPRRDRLLLSSAARFLASPWGAGSAAASEAAKGALIKLTTSELERLRSRADALLLQRRLSEVGSRPEHEREGEARGIQRWIVRANEQGVPANELARLVGVHPRTVSYLANAARNGLLTSFRRPVSLFGREKKLDDEARRLLEADLGARPAATIDERREYLEGATGLKIGRGLVATEISRLGFRYVRQAGFGTERTGYWARRDDVGGAGTDGALPR